MKNKKRYIFLFLLFAYLLLTLIFPHRGEGLLENVYSYGIFSPFLTIYSREFLNSVGSSSAFQFSFNLLQLGVDILLIWLFTKLIVKICIRK